LRVRADIDVMARLYFTRSRNKRGQIHAGDLSGLDHDDSPLIDFYASYNGACYEHQQPEQNKDFPLFLQKGFPPTLSQTASVW
jgi:hypothetical protein